MSGQPELKKAVLFLGCSWGFEMSVCCKGDMGQKCLVEGWWEGDWWVEEDSCAGGHVWGVIKQLAIFHAQILNENEVTHSVGVL